jgi:3-phenylpropionate/trans-cinnamate dioxygenase ferredoxin subunit
MDEWAELRGVDGLAPGAGRTVNVRGKSLAVFRVNGELCAIDDSCPHAGGALGRGKLEGCVVRCPAHGLKFDVHTGCMPGVPGLRVGTYPIKHENDRYWIDLA